LTFNNGGTLSQGISITQYQKFCKTLNTITALTFGAWVFCSMRWFMERLHFKVISYNNLGKNDFEKCTNIIKNDPIEYDEDITSECKLLIKELIKLNPSERLKMKLIF
jgi:hypothetical protein